MIAPTKNVPALIAMLAEMPIVLSKKAPMVGPSIMAIESAEVSIEFDRMIFSWETI